MFVFILPLLAQLCLGSDVVYERLNLATFQTEKVRLNTDEHISTKANSRHRRAIFDTDGRFKVQQSNYGTRFPFDTIVKINVGCSGIMVSPRHVLTAAHCVHDGTKFRLTLKRLRVGILKNGSKKKKSRGRKRKHTSGKSAAASSAKSSRRRRAVDNMTERARFRRFAERQPRSKSRSKSRRSKNTLYRKKTRQESRMKRNREKKSFKWESATQIYIPQQWQRNANDTRPVREMNLELDYAVVELDRDVAANYMRFSISPDIDKLVVNRIHFSGFDMPQQDVMSYRFCSINEQTKDLILQRCDADEGSSGAGMYVRYYVPEIKRWSRKIIGIFSGNMKTYDADGHPKVDYNVGVRITPEKYLEICRWVYQDEDQCLQMRNEQLHRRPYVQNPTSF